MEDAATRVKSELTAVKAAITAHDGEIQEQEGRITRRGKIDEILPEQEVARDTLDGDIRTLSESIAQEKATQASLAERIAVLTEKLCFESEEASRKARAGLVKEKESLNQAIRALLTLTEGNRLVGIISHVAELKERIEKQIVVTKEKSGGSAVRII